MIYSKGVAIAFAMACVFPASPAAADPDKDESGKGRSYHYHDRHDRHYGDDDKRAEGKEEFWDGHCKVERKWERSGEYKEERKCRGEVHAEPAPGVVITLPPIVITATER